VFGVFNIRVGAGLSGTCSLKIETATGKKKNVVLEAVLPALPLMRISTTYYFITNKFYADWLVTGHWSLVTGCWLLVAGYWIRKKTRK